MAIEATLHMNKICFPMEMLIGRYEVEHLIDGGALVVGWQPKQAIEGLLVLVPEHVVAEELRDVDLEYSPDEVGGLYIFNRCSEMASKERCATKLLRHALDYATQNQYHSLSSHCRTSNSWHLASKKTLQPQEARIVEGFWEKDGAVEFQRRQL